MARTVGPPQVERLGERTDDRSCHSAAM